MCIVGNRISREQINCRLESIRAIQIKNRLGFTKEFQPWDALLISRFNIVQSKDIFNVNRFFFGINKYPMWSSPLLKVRKNTLKISFLDCSKDRPEKIRPIHSTLDWCYRSTQKWRYRTWCPLFRQNERCAFSYINNRRKYRHTFPANSRWEYAPVIGKDILYSYYPEMFPAFCPAYPSTHRNPRIQQRGTFRSIEEKDRRGHLHRQTQPG